MKKLGVLFGLMFCVLAHMSADEADSLLLFSNRHIDLGTVFKEEPVRRFSIEFSNHMADTLNIYTVEVSCECLQVDYPHQPILRDGSGQLDCTLDMSPYDRGFFRKEIFIYSNLQQEPIELNITGRLLPREQASE